MAPRSSVAVVGRRGRAAFVSTPRDETRRGRTLPRGVHDRSRLAPRREERLEAVVGLHDATGRTPRARRRMAFRTLVFARFVREYGALLQYVLYNLCVCSCETSTNARASRFLELLSSSLRSIATAPPVSCDDARHETDVHRHAYPQAHRDGASLPSPPASRDAVRARRAARAPRRPPVRPSVALPLGSSPRIAR